MSEKYELGFDPIDSPTLNKTFNSKEVKNIDEKYESLIAWGIEPKFAEQLDVMFEEIRASADEIMKQKPNILIANNKIEKHGLRDDTKTSLGFMRAMNDPEFLDSDVA